MNILVRTNGEECGAVFDRRAVFDKPGDDGARDFALDLVHQLHRFDDAENLTGFDDVAHTDERGGAGRSRGVEGADNRRLHSERLVIFDGRSGVRRRDVCDRVGSRRGGEGNRRRGTSNDDFLLDSTTNDADAVFAALDFEFSYARIDEGLN